ncbi:hypothetical protein GCK72_002072 [Caenorhabditis remanei]|uniref:Uncharacterized protein n=1 Tax=Caenorhabditis remanei TaxID=31234 RepID=A0A6A5HUD7_CAERE|nr:hypothetical protein GCK72_002072 [Caenorhabditis remanei]KAF1770254.1 hypothetical protein GCK72_002072 [Caenorhabditis remanei]
MPVPPQAQKVLDDIDKQLHEPSTVTNVLATVESKTGVKRLHLVLGVVALQALYLVFGHSAQLVCNIMGFVYPAYMRLGMKMLNRLEEQKKMKKMGTKSQ